MSSDGDFSVSEDRVKCNTKKRKRTARVRDADKKMLLQNHETSNDCKCTRKTTKKQRSEIIKYFNSLRSWNE